MIASLVLDAIFLFDRSLSDLIDTLMNDQRPKTKYRVRTVAAAGAAAAAALEFGLCHLVIA